MSSGDDKENERRLLLKRIFTPYASTENLLFRICKESGDEYCLKFEDTGLTKNYEKCDDEQVVMRTAKLLTDDNLLTYCEKYKDHLNEYHNFKGQYYTYSYQTRTLKIESEWTNLEKKLRDMILHHHKNAKAVLEAIYEVNVDHNKYDNYLMIQTLAKEKGLKEGWYTIISKLELIGVIRRSRGEMTIPDEMIEFWRRFLGH